MRNKQKIKQSNKLKRIKRVRAQIKGTAKRPRLAVFRSLKHISVQLIDDDKSTTILAVSDKEVAKGFKGNKIEKAHEVGVLVAKKALTKKIKQIVFDRRGYKYHGRVKSVAEGARKGGLKF